MIGELVRGVNDGLRGARYLGKHPRLWIWVAAPAVLAAVVLVLAIVWIVGVLSAPIAAIAAFMPGAWLEAVLKIVATIVLAIGSITIFASVAAVIASPFNEMLSEAIEERETGVPAPRFSVFGFVRDVVVGMIHALRRVSVYLMATLGLLLVGLLVPVVGTVAAMVGTAYATARFASYDAYDAVWSRRHWRYRDKTKYLRDHASRTLGLGAIVGVVLIVPGVNVIGLAIGATAATLRMIDAERIQRTPVVANILPAP
ncbi:MAG: EI24 domain-containing protein [Kofleriaceae bacterium]|nr:EI24 domain-containing protein [Kofleriaceae bacterium]